MAVDNFDQGRKWIDKLLSDFDEDQYAMCWIVDFPMYEMGEEDVKSKFPAMYNAFTYGAPPHAGAAPGIDRIVMLLCGEESIREIITFPMNKNAQDLMMDAPTTVSQKQLDDVHILINEAHLN